MFVPSDKYVSLASFNHLIIAANQNGFISNCDDFSFVNNNE
jgi:hypothetical protein